MNFQLGLDSYFYDEKDPESSTITKITGDYDKYYGLSTIMASQGKTDGVYYAYTKGNITYYTSENDLLSTAFVEDEKDPSKLSYYGTYTFDYQGAQKTTREVSAIAALTQEDTGRLSTIQIIQSDDIPEMIGQTYSISTNSKEDESLYTQAMNDYEYEKMLYEREVDKINAKTEKLQEEDRALELQINQLDTEHNALNTEMDSVKKVIEDTMEKVFKTFSG